MTIQGASPVPEDRLPSGAQLAAHMLPAPWPAGAGIPQGLRGLSCSGCWYDNCHEDTQSGVCPP